MLAPNQIGVVLATTWSQVIGVKLTQSYQPYHLLQAKRSIQRKVILATRVLKVKVYLKPQNLRHYKSLATELQ